MSEYQIHQIMPCAVPMEAVFFDLDEEETVRQEIQFLAIIRGYAPDGDGKGEGCPDFIRGMVGLPDGDFVDPAWLDGFLGVEFSGKHENWDEEIRQVILDGEKKSPRLAS
jgi:hypothetical protein